MKSLFYLLKRWASRTSRAAAAPLHFTNVTSTTAATLHFTNVTSHPY